MKKQIIYLLCATALLSSCRIYKSYDRPEEIRASGLYRDTLAVGDTLVSDTANFGNLPWKEVFTDPVLRQLIDQGLNSNVDLQTALLKVREAQAMLMSSRLAFLPSLALAPQGTIASFDKKAATRTYQLPVVSSWEIDLFGNLLNAKRGAKTALLQTKAYRQAVQTQIVAGIANIYYTLLMLDRQLEISEKTAETWEKNVETMKAMKEAGYTNEAAVVQTEATYYMVRASLPELKQAIRETENSLSVLLGQTPQAITRGEMEEQQLPEDFSVGIPVQLLSNRPDVKAAEMALAGTYYNANQARSAFYPQITISGSAGWTNSAGSAIVNPGKLLASVVGSLTQPLFYRGTNIARLQIARAQQEEARLAFRQSLLNAGAEVSNALYQYQTANDKSASRQKQVEALEKSVEYTKELFRLGPSTSYIEILTAEQSLLSARLSQVSDHFDRMQAVVNLYQALGGGRGE